MANYTWATGPSVLSTTINTANLSGSHNSSFPFFPNKAAAMYAVAILRDAPAPSGLQIKNGQDSYGSPVPNVHSGMSDINTIWNLNLSGLSGETSYDIYFVLYGYVGTYESVTYVQADTQPHLPAPIFTTYPYFMSATGSVCNFYTGDTDIASNEYAEVLSLGSPTPTSLQVKNGVDGSGNPAINSTSTGLGTNIALYDMTANTLYDFYFVAANLNDLDSLQPTPYKLQQSTATAVIPNFKLGYPNLEGIVSTGVQVNFDINLTYEQIYLTSPYFYCVALDFTNPNIPSPIDIQNGTDGLGNPAIAQASDPIGSLNYVKLSGLSSGSNYSVYSVVISNDGNSTVERLDFTTASSTVLPLWSATYPKLSTSSDIALMRCSNSSGNVYYVILNGGNPDVPNVNQVKSGTDGADNPGVYSFNTVIGTDVEFSNPIYSLTPSTSYDAYFVLTNADGDSTIEKISFTSQGFVAPEFDVGYPKTANITSTTLDFLFKDGLSSPVFVVLHRSAPVPNTTQIRNGTDGTGGRAAYNYWDNNYALIDFSTEKNSYDISLTHRASPYGLTPGTQYSAYFYLSDSVSDSSVYSLDFQTTGGVSTFSSFSSNSVSDGTLVTSIINRTVLAEALSSDPYFDTTAEIDSVLVYYKHEDGRQSKRINHVLDHLGNLKGLVSWSSIARDGTWQKIKIKVLDKDGAEHLMTRTDIGTGEDITHSGGTMFLNT